MAFEFLKKKSMEGPEIPPQLEALPSFDDQMPRMDQVRDLTGRGFSPMPIQMQPLPPAPSPMRYAPAKPRTEEIQEIAEAIIAEKWRESAKEIDAIKKWKDETESALSNLSDRMTKLEMKLDSIEQAILGKVEEYGKGIQDVGTELKAMQRVFQTTMPTFVENIKELQGLVGEAKSKGIRKK